MHTKQLYFLFVLFIAGGVVYLANRYFEPHALAEMRVETITLDGAAVTVRVAETTADQNKGLMGVAKLADSEGMLFPFSPAHVEEFWNQGMLIPFDLLWVRNGRVLGIEHNIPALDTNSPVKITSPTPITGVVELAAGWADRHRVRIGDQIFGL